jgi:hypothetical protein
MQQSAEKEKELELLGLKMKEEMIKKKIKLEME